jgi:S-adenosylmethionine decarboxylase
MHLTQITTEASGLGTHLIVDLHHASRLDDLEHVEGVLRKCVQSVAATLLQLHVHRFPTNAGVSAVAVLAESHMSLHTWPEKAFAAFDAFTCGMSDPALCLPVLSNGFKPGFVNYSRIARGQFNGPT